MRRKLKSLPHLLIATAIMISSMAPFARSGDSAQKQLLIISFDGAHDNSLWEKSLSIAARTGAKFTYFLSCTFAMTRDQRLDYRAPGQRSGRSNVGFGENRDDVRQRLEYIWNARENGHEIASHGCGHFDGKNWSRNDWVAEFEAFDTILANAWTGIKAGDFEPAQWRRFVDSEIVGFRAPYLSTNGNLTAALKQTGYTYDASGVSRGPVSPRYYEDFSTFDLPLIPEGPANRRIIAMDYNLFVRHSGGLENRARSAAFEERTYQAFRRAFDSQYNGQRKPLQIGFHFVEMNGGAYWRAMERLVSDVCLREDVDCISYQEAIKRQKKGDGGA